MSRVFLTTLRSPMHSIRSEAGISGPNMLETRPGLIYPFLAIFNTTHWGTLFTSFIMATSLIICIAMSMSRGSVDSFDVVLFSCGVMNTVRIDSWAYWLIWALSHLSAPPTSLNGQHIASYRFSRIVNKVFVYKSEICS